MKKVLSSELVVTIFNDYGDGGDGIWRKTADDDKVNCGDGKLQLSDNCNLYHPSSVVIFVFAVVYRLPFTMRDKRARERAENEK